MSCCPKYLSVLFTSEERTKRETDRPVCCGEEKAECESEVVNLPDDLLSHPHLFPRAVGNERKNEVVAKMSFF